MPSRLSALGIVVVVLGTSTSMSASAALFGPRSAPSATATAYAVIATIPTASSVEEMTLANANDADPRDDTLFVGTNNLYVYPPLAGTGSTWTEVTLSGNVSALGVGANDLYAGVRLNSDDTLLRFPLSIDGAIAPLSSAVLAEEAGVIATGPDDSVYVGYYNNRFVIDAYSPDLGSTRIINLPDPSVVGMGLLSIVVRDDTLYTSGWNSNSGYLGQVSLVTDDSQSYTPGVGAVSVAVGGGRVLLGMLARDLLSLNADDWDDSFSATYRGEGLAIWGTTVFATGNSANAVTIAPLSTLVAQQTVNVAAGAAFDGGIQVAGDGVAYVALDSSGVAVLAPATASLATALDVAGAAVQIDIGLPTYRDMDDSAVSAVWWGDDTVPFARVGGANAVGVTAPAGTGAVPVVVEFNGGGAVNAGTFNYPQAPSPTPATPATAPQAVSATAGDGSAAVAWSAPASSGSYPVTYYLATSSPEGRTCLTSSLSCTVAGLSNGTAYTFTVQALTGAGWSPSSDPSNAVTPVAVPRPTITITGAREGKRISVTGSTTGIGMGGLVTPWTSREGAIYVPGRDVLVSADGTFTWSRRAKPQTTWRVYFTAEGLSSNTVTIR